MKCLNNNSFDETINNPFLCRPFIQHFVHRRPKTDLKSIDRVRNPSGVGNRLRYRPSGSGSIRPVTSLPGPGQDSNGESTYINRFYLSIIFEIYKFTADEVLWQPLLAGLLVGLPCHPEVLGVNYLLGHFYYPFGRIRFYVINSTFAHFNAATE